MSPTFDSCRLLNHQRAGQVSKPVNNVDLPPDIRLWMMRIGTHTLLRFVLHWAGCCVLLMLFFKIDARPLTGLSMSLNRLFLYGRKRFLKMAPCGKKILKQEGFWEVRNVKHIPLQFA